MNTSSPNRPTKPKKPHYLNQVPKRTWAQRNPRAFIITFTTSCLLVFFSRPLYDAFFREYPEQNIPLQAISAKK